MPVSGESNSPEGQLLFDRNESVVVDIIEQSMKAFSLRKKDAKNAVDFSSKEFKMKASKSLAHCNSRKSKECEIFLVEGDSAGGTAKQGGDKYFQAVLALRGKVLNVEKSSIGKVMDSDDILNIFSALGCGNGEYYDESKLKYHKIIILTDADVDGEHIRTLLLTLFYRYAPELIYSGKVFIGNPPLYKATYTKNRKEVHEYLHSEKELERLKKKVSNVKTQRYKGLGEMNAEQLWDTTLNPKIRDLTPVEISDTIETDKTVNLLMGSKVEPRKKFIIEESKKKAR